MKRKKKNNDRKPLRRLEQRENGKENEERKMNVEETRGEENKDEHWETLDWHKQRSRKEKEIKTRKST